MLQDPELRKRYFSVVEMEELEENEFNLNIPRYVDTFEPEDRNRILTEACLRCIQIHYKGQKLLVDNTIVKHFTNATKLNMGKYRIHHTWYFKCRSLSKVPKGWEVNITKE